MITIGGSMFSRWFKPRLDTIGIAEEMGYNDGYLGLSNTNPYRYQSPEWVAYNYGWNEANRDVDEYIWPTEEVWPYTDLQ